jgi:glycosyltransferase involved in cell wall biosynthesis
MIEVSVIIPVYNVAQYIERCARSLFEQTLEKIEFIFVDDCSTDNTMDILSKVIKDYPNRNNLILIQPINRGVSAARELAISKATGKYIGFCDSDDWVEPEMYEKLLKTATEHNCDIVGTGYWEHYKNNKKKCTFYHQTDERGIIFSPYYFGGIYGALWNKLIKKEFFDKNSKDLWKGITMWEDSCMLIPLRLNSSKTIFINECLYHYNVNTNSMTTKFSMKKVSDAIEATKRLELYFKKEGLSNDASELIKFLKIASKEVLLRFPQKEYVKMWKETFPETKWYIINYPNWNFILKVRAILVSFFPLFIGTHLLKIKKHV